MGEREFQARQAVTATQEKSRKSAGVGRAARPIVILATNREGGTISVVPFQDRAL